MAEFINPFSGVVPGKKLSFNELTRCIRMSLAAEEEATHLYEAIAEATDNPLAKAVMLDIANEERVHAGEFQRLLELLLPDEKQLLADGAAEVNEMAESLGQSKSESPAMDPKTIGNLKQ